MPKPHTSKSPQLQRQRRGDQRLLPPQAHTVASDRDSFRLLLQQTATAPAKLHLEDLDATTITRFLGAGLWCATSE